MFDMTIPGSVSTISRGQNNIVKTITKPGQVMPQTPAIVISHGNNNNYSNNNQPDNNPKDQWFREEEFMRKKLEKNAIS